MKTYRVTRTNVLLKQKKAESQTKGGILIPDMSKQAPLQGTVEGIGPGVETVVVGDRVLFDRFAGVKIVLDEKPYLILDEADILVIF